MSKKWYNSKTIQLAFLTSLIGLFTAVAGVYPEAGWVITLVGILNGLLRLVTTTSVE